ncbi:hypothetical protein [Sphingomonas sp. PR090111-T3T-6A]|uniref:hypothetical protein n=1 Tax=Sphingomonas sp. PR090111-T3T-6A TaxID=685778 RepID=UPI00037BB0F0|nr:hypothetical protein [Sphingomonas sp. PR090111-T3T-6A]
MTDTMPFNRMMTAGLDLWRLQWRVAETMLASQSVIATRIAMMGAGLGDPRRIPFAEMARFVPEKMAAFDAAGRGAARHLAAMEGAGMLELFESGLAASLAWWAPLHGRSTANARRLGRRRR